MAHVKNRIQPVFRDEHRQSVRVNPSTWKEVRSAAGRLLFKINPERRLIQVRMKGETTTIDLEEWIDCSASGPSPS